ncbi:MAG: hypothetical protein CMG74_13225 [Candidatus Marinimicrobia bacterium]|nr:hypothetical protein [Candidatus Neomarinimicrobiota bacterium]
MIIFSAVGPLYTPKIILFSIPFLPGELLGIILSIYFLLKGVKINSFIKYFGIYTLIMCYSTFYSPLYREYSFSPEMTILAIKRILILLLFFSAFFISKNEIERLPQKILFLYSLPFIIHLGFIIINIFQGIDFSSFWSKNPKTNLTLLTYWNIIGGKLVPIGNTGTSPQLGVFSACLSLIFLSLYSQLKEKKYLLLHILFVLALIFTVSRSGLLAFIIGIIFYLSIDKTNIKYKYIFFSSILIFCLGIFAFGFITKFGLINRLINYGGIQDTSSGLRIYIWSTYFLGISNNPWLLLTGIGFNSNLPSHFFSGGSLFVPGSFESLYLDAIAFGGIFCLLFLLMAWYKLFKITEKYSQVSNIYNRSILRGIYAFIPGYFCANFFGNSFQTDFFQSFFLIITGLIYFDIMKTTDTKKY